MAEPNSIEKLKNILEIIDNRIIWSELSEVDKFPEWFINQFTPKMSNKEAALWMKIWRSVSKKDQHTLRENAGWSFDGWIYWLHPDNRIWYVIGAHEYAGGKYSVTLLAEEWPAPMGAFLWLLKTVGATHVEIA